MSEIEKLATTTDVTSLYLMQAPAVWTNVQDRRTSVSGAQHAITTLQRRVVFIHACASVTHCNHTDTQDASSVTSVTHCNHTDTQDASSFKESQLMRRNLATLWKRLNHRIHKSSANIVPILPDVKESACFLSLPLMTVNRTRMNFSINGQFR